MPIPTRCRPPGTSGSEEPCNNPSVERLYFEFSWFRLTKSVGSGSSHNRSPETNRSGLSIPSTWDRPPRVFVTYLCLGVLVRYNESQRPYPASAEPTKQLTKINGPDTCPRREVDQSLRILDRGQEEFPVQYHETQFV